MNAGECRHRDPGEYHEECEACADDLRGQLMDALESNHALQSENDRLRAEVAENRTAEIEESVLAIALEAAAINQRLNEIAEDLRMLIVAAGLDQ